jgi:uncharacterized RDD family membrane protein YckC
MSDQYPTSPEPSDAVPGYTPPSDPGSYQAPAGGYSEPPAVDPYAAPAGAYPPPPAPNYGGGFAPAPTGGAGTLSEWPTRALGGLIDYVGPNIVISVVTNLLANVNSTLGYLVNFVLFFGWWAYLGFLSGKYGVTPGRAIAKTKLISEETGDVIGVNNGIIRQLAHLIDYVICLVGFLFPLWDAKKQTIADKLMKTVVVDNSADPTAGQIRWS